MHFRILRFHTYEILKKLCSGTEIIFSAFFSIMLWVTNIFILYNNANMVTWNDTLLTRV
jgi:hypothetical protein